MEREVSEVDRKLLLKKTYLDKIHYYLTRNPIDQEELYSIIRKFFSEYLKLDYEFTYEELSQELNKVFIKPKVKEHVDTFLIRLSESEYLEEKSLGTAEINGFLRELDDIIRNIIFDDQPIAQEEGSTLIQKVLKIKHKESSKVMDISGVSMLIDEINFHVTNGNLDIAKNSYVELLKSYDVLSKDDKKKLHDDMNEVYERLQTLIKNPKSSNTKGTAVGTAVVDDKQNLNEFIKRVMDLGEETIFYINASNLDLAKKSYAETLRAYESLNPEEKKSMHSRVNDLYVQLQTLSSRPALSTQKLTTKGLSNIIESIPEDLPELEPLSESGASVGNRLVASSNQVSTATQIASANQTVPTTQVASSTSSASNISTASFVEEFGKSVANTGLSNASNATFFNTKDTTSANTSSSNNNINTTGSNTTSSNVNSNIASNSTQNANIASALSSNVSDYDAARESFAEEIDTDRLATTSGVANMLFTATASDDIVDKKSVELVSTSKKSMVKPVVASVIQSKPVSVAPVSPVVAQVKPVLTQVKQESRPVPSKSIQSESVSPVVRPTSQQTPVLTPQSTSPTNPIPTLQSTSLPNTIPTPQTIKSSIAQYETKKAEIKIESKPILPILPEIKIPSVSQLSSLSTSPLVSSPISSSTVSSTHSSIPSSFSSQVSSPTNSKIDKLNVLLKKIDDDIVMDKFDKAKETYKEALLIYRPMRDSEKSKCYEHFFATFKKLDDALHQKSLHDILDKHLSESAQSNRPLASKKSGVSSISGNLSGIPLESYSSESAEIINATTLPIILTNDLATTRVYELIEESYFNMDNTHPDLAMLKYFKALDSYHKLPIDDKKKLYSDLYALFKKLSTAKKN